MFKFYRIVTFFFSTLVLSLNAQETITTTGLNTIGPGGTISYSIGQVNVARNTGAGGSVFEGVQQPYIIEPTVGVGNTNINLKLASYPNSTTDHIVLSAQ